MGQKSVGDVQCLGTFYPLGTKVTVYKKYKFVFNVGRTWVEVLTLLDALQLIWVQSDLFRGDMHIIQFIGTLVNGLRSGKVEILKVSNKNMQN